MGIKIEKPGATRVTWHAPDVLEVCWSGQVGGLHVSQALAESAALLGERRVTWLFVDTEHVNGYDLSVRSPSVEFLRFFKERGLIEIVAVMPNRLVSMFAATMRLVTKVRFAVYPTRLAATRYLAAKLASAAPAL